MTQEAATLYIPASKLGEYPQYRLDSTKKPHDVRVTTCDTCGLETEECFKQNTKSGKWNESHSLGRFTSSTEVQYVWINLPAYQVEQSHIKNKRVKEEA